MDLQLWPNFDPKFAANLKKFRNLRLVFHKLHRKSFMEETP